MRNGWDFFESMPEGMRQNLYGPRLTKLLKCCLRRRISGRTMPNYKTINRFMGRRNA